MVEEAWDGVTKEADLLKVCAVVAVAVLGSAAGAEAVGEEDLETRNAWNCGEIVMTGLDGEEPGTFWSDV